MHRMIGFALVLVCAASPAFAEHLGSYFEIRGGGHFVEDSEVSSAPLEFEQSFDSGFMVEAATGYADESGLRGELAIAYRSADLDEVTVINDGGLGVAIGVGSLNGITAKLDGDITAWTLMANGYYDILKERFRPYIGAGIGLALIDVDAKIFGIQIVDSDDAVLAYQALAGFAYNVTPEVAVTLNYAYLATLDPEFETVLGDPFDAEFASHNIMLGVRLNY